MYRRHTGDLVMLCYACYHNRPKSISTRDEHDPHHCSHRQLRHVWSDNKLLVYLMHSAENGQTLIQTIAERKFRHKDSFFPLCHYGQFCTNDVSREFNDFKDVRYSDTVAPYCTSFVSAN